MRCLVVLLTAMTAAYAKNLAWLVPGENTVFGYLTKIGVPEAERLRQAERNNLGSDVFEKIIGGQPSELGLIPYQAGIIVSIVGSEGVAVCSGSLVSNRRVLTAAHCWFDGRNQAWKFTVVLGSLKVFSGGLRIDTSTVISHPEFSAPLARNDIAVIHLHVIPLTTTISPIALPSGWELYDTFVGSAAIASGYGLTSQSESTNINQFLSYVTLPIISNGDCLPTYPSTLQQSNICTSGVGPRGTCHGDSGGPLAVFRNRRWVLIGLTSFGSPAGCEAGLPTVFTRITSYLSFINKNL